MSRGVLDQEAYDAAVAATAHATAHGLKIVGGRIHHHADGSRRFAWEFAPIEKTRRRKADPAPAPPSPRRIKRGGVDVGDPLPAPAQGELL